MPQIYLVDDDQDVLDSLNWLLTGIGYTPHCFLSADAFLAHASLAQAGVAILDIQMPGMDGVALLNYLKQQQSPLSVIMLTGHGTISMAVKTIQKGAVDFLEKPVDGDKLVLLIEKALMLSNEQVAKQEMQAKQTSRLASLTPRELQVMEKVLEGKLNKVIAAELNIAQRTIELHRQKVMQKMQVSNVAELAYLMGRSVQE